LVVVAVDMGITTRTASNTSWQLSKRLEVEEFVEKRAPAFKQCGGKGFKAIKCEKGCFCKAQNEYFHLCQAPGGASQCDPYAAKNLADKAKKKAAPFVDAAKKAAAKKEATAKAYTLAAKKASATKTTAEKAAKDKAEKGAAADRLAASKIKAVEDNTVKEKQEAKKAKIAAEKVLAEVKKTAVATEDTSDAAADKKLDAELAEVAKLKKIGRTNTDEARKTGKDKDGKKCCSCRGGCKKSERTRNANDQNSRSGGSKPDRGR